MGGYIVTNLIYMSTHHTTLLFRMTFIKRKQFLNKIKFLNLIYTTKDPWEIELGWGYKNKT